MLNAALRVDLRNYRLSILPFVDFIGLVPILSPIVPDALEPEVRVEIIILDGVATLPQRVSLDLVPLGNALQCVGCVRLPGGREERRVVQAEEDPLFQNP